MICTEIIKIKTTPSTTTIQWNLTFALLQLFLHLPSLSIVPTMVLTQMLSQWILNILSQLVSKITGITVMAWEHGPTRLRITPWLKTIAAESMTTSTTTVTTKTTASTICISLPELSTWPRSLTLAQSDVETWLMLKLVREVPLSTIERPTNSLISVISQMDMALTISQSINSVSTLTLTSLSTSIQSLSSTLTLIRMMRTRSSLCPNRMIHQRGMILNHHHLRPSQAPQRISLLMFLKTLMIPTTVHQTLTREANLSKTKPQLFTLLRTARAISSRI